jgi:hypothetical protein
MIGKKNTMVFAATILLSLLLLAPTLWFGFGPDQGLHAYGGWALRHYHLAPYVGCFDHNFPGIFFLHYLVQGIFGETMTAFRLADLLWETATAAVIYVICVDIFKDRFVGFLSAALYAVYYVKLGPWHTGQRDGMMSLLCLGGFLLILKSRSSALAGLLFGCAFLLKPTALLTAAVIGSYLLMKRRILAAVAFAGAFALPTLAVILYYLHINALRELFEATITFNSAVYSGASDLPMWVRVESALMMNFWYRNLLVLAGILLLMRRHGRAALKNSLWLIGVFAAVFLGYLAQGKFYPYQQAPVWAILCIFAAVGWACLFKARAARIVLAASIIAVSLCLGPDPMAGNVFKMTPSEGQLAPPYTRTCMAAAKYLDDKTAATDKVQVWGGEALINFLAKRGCPSRFPSTLSLIFRPGKNRRSETQRKFGNEILRSVSSSPPPYFVVCNEFHPSFGIASDREILESDYPALNAFITSHYELDTEMGGFAAIYKLKR